MLKAISEFCAEHDARPAYVIKKLKRCIPDEDKRGVGAVQYGILGKILAKLEEKIQKQEDRKAGKLQGAQAGAQRGDDDEAR